MAHVKCCQCCKTSKGKRKKEGCIQAREEKSFKNTYGHSQQKQKSCIFIHLCSDLYIQ